MKEERNLGDFGLKFNPFPSAASGVAFTEATWIPRTWAEELGQRFDQLENTGGGKAIIIIGEYGSGKTYLLRWIMENQYNKKRIKPYFIQNPGTMFYELANHLLGQIGRKEFSKGLWESIYDELPKRTLMSDMFGHDFDQWLNQLNDRTKRDKAKEEIQNAIIEHALTSDDEIAFRFGQMIVETRNTPFYKFQDFLPRSIHTMVAEKKEADYFKAIIRILQTIYETNGIAFLVDEFEDISIGRKMTRRQTVEYHTTFRHLLNTADEENFWVSLSTTPYGYEQTRDIEPPLVQRFGFEFRIPALTEEDARGLIQHRLNGARTEESNKNIWPFEEDVISAMTESTWSWPRGLVKHLSRSLAESINRGLGPPVPNDLVKELNQIQNEHPNE